MADINEVVDPQQELLKALMSAYPQSIQRSADTEATARMQKRRMDRTKWGGKGLLGLAAGMIGNKVADKRRPEYESALSDAIMAKSNQANMDDKIGRMRDIAQEKIERRYEFDLKEQLADDAYWRKRGGEISDRDNEREHAARLLAAANAREDEQKGFEQKRKIELKETPAAPAPLTDKDRQTYSGKLLDVNDALTILGNARESLKSRSGQPGDSLIERGKKMFLPDTGPVDQYAIGKWGQGFDAMSKQLFAVAKRIYKAPGEGQFSDADAEALVGMLFNSGNYSDVNLKLIDDLEKMLTDRGQQFSKMAGQDEIQLPEGFELD